MIPPMTLPTIDLLPRPGELLYHATRSLPALMGQPGLGNATAQRSGSKGAIAGWVLPVSMSSARNLPVAGPNTMPHMPCPPVT